MAKLIQWHCTCGSAYGDTLDELQNGEYYSKPFTCAFCGVVSDIDEILRAGYIYDDTAKNPSAS